MQCALRGVEYAECRAHALHPLQYPPVRCCTVPHRTAPRLPYPALDFTALHFTALHFTALHCTALQCTALHCTALHCTALHSAAPVCSGLSSRIELTVAHSLSLFAGKSCNVSSSKALPNRIHQHSTQVSTASVQYSAAHRSTPEHKTAQHNTT